MLPSTGAGNPVDSGGGVETRLKERGKPQSQLALLGRHRPVVGFRVVFGLRRRPCSGSAASGYGAAVAIRCLGWGAVVWGRRQRWGF
jgi:hypothetical protein